MPVAIIEIADRATSRSGTNKQTGQGWEIWTQAAYVHGQNGAYPAPLTLDIRDANSAYQPGFYMLDGSAVAMIQPDGGKGFPRPGLKLRDLNALIPLGEAHRQIAAFMDAREAVAA